MYDYGQVVRAMIMCAHPSLLRGREYQRTWCLILRPADQVHFTVLNLWVSTNQHGMKCEMELDMK